MLEESYAWISLDESKLAEMDEVSVIDPLTREVKKEKVSAGETAFCEEIYEQSDVDLRDMTEESDGNPESGGAMVSDGNPKTDETELSGSNQEIDGKGVSGGNLEVDEATPPADADNGTEAPSTVLAHGGDGQFTVFGDGGEEVPAIFNDICCQLG